MSAPWSPNLTLSRSRARPAGEPPAEPAGPDLAEHAYRLLLRAYPAAFRAAYGREVVQLFRDLRQDHHREDSAAGLGPFWTAVLWDVARSAPALRLDALRAWWDGRRDRQWKADTHIEPGGGTMKVERTVAVVAMLVGVLEVANALAEGRAGLTAHRGGAWMLAVAVGVAAGMLLVVAGLALPRRTPGAARVACAAALACAAAVVGTQLISPWMSIASSALGIAVPIAVLLAAGRTRGPSVPAVA